MTGSRNAGGLHVAVLGPLVVSGPGGDPIAVVSAPQRRLLTLLTIHVGTVVRAERLAEWLRLSPGALRTSISRLRRVIGSDVLETTPRGYRLWADVDAVAFERQISHALDVDDAAARTTLETAIGLWRGEPLIEFAGEPWAEPSLARWTEQYVSAQEELAVLQLDAGDVTTALTAIQRLVEREPYRDRPRALLQRALAEGGRPTEALRAFQSYRTLLRDEVGTEPSLMLVELDRAVARSNGSESAFGPLPGHPAWTRSRRRGAPARANQCGPPVPLSSFVGRRHDLTTVSELLATHRLVTLTGAGGCGKTRLAIALATATADRGVTTCWAELGVLAIPADVVEQVATAIGVTPQPTSDPTPQLIAHLAGQPPMLLVIDNAEHLLAPVVDLVTALLPRCPSLQILVTSRHPLGIAGEAVWRVPSLETPLLDARHGDDELLGYDAVQLFLERAREARPGFVADADALRHIASISVGVDGLPLALELAAARTRTQPIDAVAKGIDDAVRWQATATGGPLARHATVHASIAWSVDLVTPLARAVLTRLSVFRSSFSLDAALTVGGAGEAPDEVVAAVGALVDASLVQFDDATCRYRILLTVRRFCALRSQPDRELERARARHARYIAAFCSQVGAGLHGIERGVFIREMPDLVAAMEWAREREPRLVFEMCAGLASVRSALGHHSNVADTWRWLLSLDRDAGIAEGWAGEWATAVAAQMAATTAHRIDVTEAIGEVDRLLPPDAARARGWLARGAAMVPAYHGRLGPIRAHIEEVRSRRDDLEFSIYGGFAAYMLALMGHIDESAQHIDELERLVRRHRTVFSVDTVGNGYAAAVLGDLMRGDLRSARGRGEHRIPDDPAFSMTAAAALAHVALVTGDGPTLERAVGWSRNPTIPVLGFLPTFIELVGRRFSGDVAHAADLAEQFWDEAAPVPVSRVHPLPILVSTLLAAGRSAVASTIVDSAEALVDGMEPAPLLRAGVLMSRSRLVVQSGSSGDAAPLLCAALEITTARGFLLLTVEILEQVAAITDDASLRTSLHASTRAERLRLGVRSTIDLAATRPTGPHPSIEQSIAPALAWLTRVAPRGEPTDARL